MEHRKTHLDLPMAPPALIWTKSSAEGIADHLCDARNAVQKYLFPGPHNSPLSPQRGHSGHSLVVTPDLELGSATLPTQTLSATMYLLAPGRCADLRQKREW